MMPTAVRSTAASTRSAPSIRLLDDEWVCSLRDFDEVKRCILHPHVADVTCATRAQRLRKDRRRRAEDALQSRNDLSHVGWYPVTDFLPVLMLFGPTTAVLLTCRYLNRRDERQPLPAAQVPRTPAHTL